MHLRKAALTEQAPHLIVVADVEEDTGLSQSHEPELLLFYGVYVEKETLTARHYYKSRHNQALILEMYFGWAQTRIFDVKFAAPRYAIDEAMESQGVVGIDAESALVICLIRVTLQFESSHVHHLHILRL